MLSQSPYDFLEYGCGRDCQMMKELTIFWVSYWGVPTPI